MRPQQASRTARQNALFRAIEARRPASARVADDPLAVRFLTPEFRLLAEAARMPSARRLIERVIDNRWPCVRGGIVARTRLIDETVQAELPRVRQVMILGAGFDSRAYRLPQMHQVPVFEGAETTLRAVRRVGEPFTFGMNPDEVPGYLADLGFKLEWDTTVSEAARRLYPEGGCPSVPAYYHVVKSMRS